jgi:hypothetical protein
MEQHSQDERREQMLADPATDAEGHLADVAAGHPRAMCPCDLDGDFRS